MGEILAINVLANFSSLYINTVWTRILLIIHIKTLYFFPRTDQDDPSILLSSPGAVLRPPKHWRRRPLVAHQPEALCLRRLLHCRRPGEFLAGGSGTGDVFSGGNLCRSLRRPWRTSGSSFRQQPSFHLSLQY